MTLPYLAVLLLVFGAGAIVGYVAGRKAGGLVGNQAGNQPFTGNANAHAASPHAASAMMQTTAAYDAPPATGNWEEEARALAKAGHKIEAIKLVRDRTGLGLKEAKDHVERW